MRRGNPRSKPLASGSARPRGATLLLAITCIAVLTAVATDLAYNVRVSLQIAANGRDELRAFYLAKSGVNLSRLVLRFQHQLDTQAGQAQGALSFGNIHLWELIPIDSGAAKIFLSSSERKEAEASKPEGAAAAPAASLGDFEGSFEAKTQDEDSKINVAQFGGMAATSVLPGLQLMRLQQLIQDPIYDALFDREDANGFRVTRNELLAALKDWGDEDEVASSLTGNPAAPFEQSGGDENFLYARAAEPYRAKNGRFDSLDELYQVAGVTDAFMAAFGDKLTVYSGMNQPININANDPDQLTDLIRAMADPPRQPALDEPAFKQNLQKALLLLHPIPFMQLQLKDLVMVVSGLHVNLNQRYFQQNAQNQPIGSQPASTFHIRASGTVGSVKKAIDAVVTMDQRTAGVQAADLGRLIHWREE